MEHLILGWLVEAGRIKTAFKRGFGLGILGIGCLVGVSGCSERDYGVSSRREIIRDRPTAVSADKYISSGTCRSCHPRNYASWYGSFHRTMTQVADVSTVVAPIGKDFSFLDQTYRLSLRGEKVWFQIDDSHSEGKFSEMRLSMITGSHHMQVYWYPTGDSRKLAQIPFVYLIEEEQWIPVGASFLTPPKSGLQVALPGAWNMACIKCHTTQGKPRSPNWGASNVSMSDLSFDTRVAEFGIACEACHGPGENHIRFHQESSSSEATEMPKDDIVNPSSLSHMRNAEVCGQCHSTFADDLASFSAGGDQYRPGDALWETPADCEQIA